MSEPAGAQVPGHDTYFRWQPKQMLLKEAMYVGEATVIGYGGSRGGAKSRGGRDILLSYCFEHPGIRAWIVMRTYPKLKDNHIDKILDERPFLRKFYRVGTRRFTSRTAVR